MTSLNERLNLILRKASLDENLKSFWREAFKHLKAGDLLTLINILEQSEPAEIVNLSVNLKNKIEAIESESNDFWEKIVEEEKNNLL